MKKTKIYACIYIQSDVKCKTCCEKQRKMRFK